jgi:hypothetical protein
VNENTLARSSEETAGTAGSDILSPTATVSGAQSIASSEGNSAGTAINADQAGDFISQRQSKHKQQLSSTTIASQTSAEKKSSVFSFESTSTSLKAMLRRKTASKRSLVSDSSDVQLEGTDQEFIGGAPEYSSSRDSLSVPRSTPPDLKSDMTSATPLDSPPKGEMQRPIFHRSRSNQSQERFREQGDAGRPRSKTVSETHSSPVTPTDTRDVSLAKPKSDLLPERIDDNESPLAYLKRITEIFKRSQLAALLSRNDEEFFQEVLREFVRTFKFVDDPLDMALRKFLMYVRLPKETQQIDRVLDAFSAMYYDQNPSIFVDSEIPYIIVFSLVILHTDFFNKNNRHKMQKLEYVRNTFARGVPSYVLECFYDNITYTPFIHTDEDVTPLSLRHSWGLNRGSFSRSSKELLDPYSLLLEGRLDSLRPNLGEFKEDPYEFVPVESKDQFLELRNQFIYGPILQLVSQRSRPEAFRFPNDTTDPQYSEPGVVDIKAVKIGTLYRQEARRVLSKATWKECGAILTASHLYIFKDVTWLKNAISSQPVVDVTSEPADLMSEPATTTIRVAMSDFNANADIATTEMVALLSSKTEPTNQQYTFVLASRGGSQEWFSASSAADLNDWLLKINFAASFSTFNVGIHGVRNLDKNHSVTLAIPHRVRATVSDSSLSINSGITDVLDFAHQKSKEFGEYHALRVEIVSQKLEELTTKEKQIEEQLDECKRASRHLKLLAPIQQKSREAVIFSAGRLAAKMEWHWLEQKRLLCYKDMLEHELQVELELCEHFESQRNMHLESILCRRNEGNRSPTLSTVSSMVPQSPSNLSSHQTDMDVQRGLQTSSPAPSSKSSHLSGYLKTVGSRSAEDSSRLSPVSTNSIYYDTGSLNTSPKVTRDRSRSPAKSVPPSPIVRKKNIRLSLREKSRPRDRTPVENDNQDKVQRSASLMRASKGDFTLHGKKFSVVEVNPEFAATPNHQRTASQTVHPRTTDATSDDGLPLQTEHTTTAEQN